MNDESTAAESGGEAEVAPPSEQVHLPGPSFLPVIVGFGITIALVGVVLNWVIFVIGFAIFLVATLIWVRDVRQDIADLPLEH